MARVLRPVGGMDVGIGVDGEATPLVEALPPPCDLVHRRVDLQYHGFPIPAQLLQRLGAVAAAPQLRTDAEMLHIAEVLRLPVEQQPHEFRPIKKLDEMVLRVGQDGPLLIGQPLLVAGKAGLVEGHRPSKRRFLRLCQPSPFHSSRSSLLKNALPFWERILFFPVYTPPRAFSRSARMSFTSSMPTEKRTRSGDTPAAASSASFIWRWVVLAG